MFESRQLSIGDIINRLLHVVSEIDARQLIQHVARLPSKVTRNLCHKKHSHSGLVHQTTPTAALCLLPTNQSHLDDRAKFGAYLTDLAEFEGLNESLDRLRRKMFRSYSLG